MTIDNPFWDAVKDHVEPDSLRATPVVGEFRLDRPVAESMARTPNRQRLVRKYCWTIPDPDTVAFVAHHAHDHLVDPLAGTGYWAYLLTQVGVDVVCYDLNPGATLLTNGWHGEDLYAEVCAKDCAEAAALHPDRTLLLSWPPHGKDIGARTLKSYGGNRVIFIGDSRGTRCLAQRHRLEPSVLEQRVAGLLDLTDVGWSIHELDPSCSRQDLDHLLRLVRVRSGEDQSDGHRGLGDGGVAKRCACAWRS